MFQLSPSDCLCQFLCYEKRRAILLTYKMAIKNTCRPIGDMLKKIRMAFQKYMSVKLRGGADLMVIIQKYGGGYQAKWGTGMKN